MAVKCYKCSYGGTLELEKEIQLHHIIPKSIGGNDGDGRVWLCISCHDRLHKELPKQLWKFIRDEDKPKAINSIKLYVKWFLNRGKILSEQEE